ncbi:unnamed protein product [Adineta steineri]|uniref:Ig-like domain-containing protein n=1 Tax=Adineta steineri TaxID=433720 RepID=A0A819U0L6_9BILA|nr:unnamed protein product [Adineta steineri]CAF4087662.1 unnamed protein product [Adineta steineri]
MNLFFLILFNFILTSQIRTDPPEEIEKDKRTKYHQHMTRCIFRIFKTTKADEGEYTCQIDDERGIKTTGSLYIEELPATLEGDQNDKIELECNVQDEYAKCDWYFESEKILRELYPDGYEIISYGNVCKLVIKKSSPIEDTEKYECKEVFCQHVMMQADIQLV